MALPTKLLIDGNLIDGAGVLSVVDPSTGAPFIEVPRGSQGEMEAAIAAAKRAQPGWAATPLVERHARLERFADAVHQNADELARTLVMEQGKPLGEARTEIAHAEFFLRHFAAADLPAAVVQDDAALRVEVHHRALGVVAGITPWNFPVLIACYKLGPSLLLGNSFILKPAPTTPVTSLMLGALARDIFPAGVVNVVTDANDLGALLTAHPDVAKISFTGSTPTGRRVMASAASTLKRITLELGGNDAAIVLDDVDVAAAAPKIFAGAFLNAGQVCIAIKRLYVHDRIYDALCSALVAQAGTTVLGNGLDGGTSMGPVQNAAQYAKARHLLDVAEADGKIVAGGIEARNGGYFVRPTIVRDIADGSALVDDEQFAPILPVVRFDDVDAVVRRTNASPYGLGGSVWSDDLDRAYALAQRIDSGTVWINHHLHFGPHIPFSGAKQSGYGVEFSEAGLAEFGQTHVISIAK
ncbi:aldehyde dehydrogenase family protein [Xanthobacter sp. KR7-225]|uniref:aldehyde dehydrogenase family protein n=1 Tax=Xanthobacter sp. KR7-225 TaxID=3156613 RepID=UPI0032B60D30